MKAGILKAIGSPLVVEEMPIPRIGPDEVLIETHTCGICRTDIHILDGLAYVPSLPHILGHEPAGVVVEVGREVTGIRPGQRVVPHLFESGMTEDGYVPVSSSIFGARIIGTPRKRS